MQSMSIRQRKAHKNHANKAQENTCKACKSSMQERAQKTWCLDKVKSIKACDLAHSKRIKIMVI